VDRETCFLSAGLRCEDPLHEEINIFIPSNFPTATLSINPLPPRDLISAHKLHDHLVQDQLAPIDEELEPLEEFNSPRNVEKLIYLRSRLVEKTTRDQKELSALDLGLFITTVDCIFDPLPSSLVQLPTPISAGPSILLTPPSLFNRIITLQDRLEKARYELTLLPRCLPLPEDQEPTESTDHQIVKEKKHIDHQ
jgi:hypothetical protein